MAAGAPLLALVAAAMAVAPPVNSPYQIALMRTCPAKHLDRLSPADLLDDLESFPRSLRPRLRDRLLANEPVMEARCARSNGAACNNQQWLRAIERLHLTRRFAARVCTVHLSCRGQSDCD